MMVWVDVLASEERWLDAGDELSWHEKPAAFMRAIGPSRVRIEVRGERHHHWRNAGYGDIAEGAYLRPWNSSPVYVRLVQQVYVDGSTGDAR